jgi:hypothetical protein
MANRTLVTAWCEAGGHEYDPKERHAGVRAVTVGGFDVRVTPVTGTERFSLKRYRELGHKVTAAMRAAICPGADYDRWKIKDVRGRRRADAIESI